MPYFDFSNTPITKDTTLEANYCCVPPAPVELTCLTAGEAIIYNKWLGTILVNGQEVPQSGFLVVDAHEGDVYKIEEGDEGVLAVWASRSRDNLNKGIVESADGATFEAKVQDMTKFCIQNTRGGWEARDYFFAYFFANGAVTKVAEKSFDTSVLRFGGRYMFEYFNYKGMVVKLPKGSFDFRNFDQGSNGSGSFGANSIPYYFMQYFNYYGALESLPEGSLVFHPKIDRAEQYAFQYFNAYGALKSLPAGSFDFFNQLYYLAQDVCQYFNYYGALESLPEGSFRFDQLSTHGGGAFSFGFASFNNHGALKSLPAGSFTFTPGTPCSSFHFDYFNYYGALESLPEGSFNFDCLNSTTGVSTSGFAYFNSYGSLKSLPAGSFRFNNLVAFGSKSFYHFNDHGPLESLPEGSFHFDSVKNIDSSNASDGIFCYFNKNGAIKKIESGAFCFPSLVAGIHGVADHGYNTYIFRGFNEGGDIEEIEDNCFQFPNLETLNDVSYAFADFAKNSKLRVIRENCFTFPKLKDLHCKYLFADFARASALEKIGKGSFTFNRDEQVVSNGSGLFSEFNYDNKNLTALPKGSFNLDNFVVAEGGDSANMFNRFNYYGGLAEGNRGVAIYAFVNFPNTGITGQESIPQGEYLYVNCDEE